MAQSYGRWLKQDVRERFPKACSAALSRTAVQCRDEMKKHIERSFDRPTPYAINASKAMPSTAATLTAAVLLREFSAKGPPAERFLGPEILGGSRHQKKFEKALASIGALKSGGFAAPGGGAQIDAYGNEPGSEIVKILSVLRACGEQGYRANRTKKWGKKNTRTGQIFVVRAGSNHAGLKPGVYKRTPNGVVCLVKFLTKAPSYRVRLPFDELVKADATRIFPKELKRAITEIHR